MIALPILVQILIELSCCVQLLTVTELSLKLNIDVALSNKSKLGNQSFLRSFRSSTLIIVMMCLVVKLFYVSRLHLFGKKETEQKTINMSFKFH